MNLCHSTSSGSVVSDSIELRTTGLRCRTRDLRSTPVARSGDRPNQSVATYAGVLLRITVLMAFVVTGVVPIVAGDEPAAMKVLGARYEKEIRPLLKRFCLECHSSNQKERQPDLERFEVFDDVRRDPSAWQKVSLMLGSGEMPPKDSDQLNTRQRKQLRSWVQSYLDTEACVRSGDPGRVVLRRLNNAEFTYTIRDLTGVELDPTRHFPVDGAAGEGFTNAANALGISPVLMQKYLDAAQEIASHAVLLHDGFRFSMHMTRRDWVREILAGIRAVYARYTSGNSDVSILDQWKTDEGTHASANDGRVDLEPYLLALIQHREDLVDGIDFDKLSSVAKQNKLSLKYMQLLARMIVAREPDSLLLESIRHRWRTASPGEVPGLANQIRTWQDKLWKVNPVGLTGLVQPWREPVSPEEGFEELKRTAGDRAGSDRAAALIKNSFDDFRRVFPASMCFARIIPVDDHVTLLLFHREDEPLGRLMLEEAEQARLDRLWDELLYVSREPVELEGVLQGILTLDNNDITQKAKPFRATIAKRAAEFRGQLVETEPVHLDALLEFISRAYRRLLTKDESQELRMLYQALRNQPMPHEEAFRLTLAKALASAAFLYRIEERRGLAGDSVDSAEPGRPPAHPVSDLELASRLSYFLWSSLPDEELRAAADAGCLTDESGSQIISHTRRMLQDSRMRRLAIEFACQWLYIRDFDQFEKSETFFPDFAALRGSMYEESIRFFTDLFQGDRSILSILHADHTFLNEQLAAHYGISGIVGEQWQRVGGIRSYSRGGILAQSAVLARHSGASRTNPILRGAFVAETLLGERLPRPPADVPQLPDTTAAGLSERELIEQHSTAAECAGCHKRIDPYGFALEAFDATGRLRKSDPGGRSLETRTTLIDGTNIDGLGGLRDYLLIQRRDDYVRQFCRKLLGFALGRAVQLSDQPLLDEMMVRLCRQNFRFSVAVETIVLSNQFRMIRAKQPSLDNTTFSQIRARSRSD